MAYETKVILASLSKHCLFVETSKQVYDIVRSMAQVEGMQLPSYEEAKAELKDSDDKND